MFPNDSLEYYVGLSDLNWGLNTEIFFSNIVDKCKTRLGIVQCNILKSLLPSIFGCQFSPALEQLPP